MKTIKYLLLALLALHAQHNNTLLPQEPSVTKPFFPSNSSAKVGIPHEPTAVPHGTTIEEQRKLSEELFLYLLKGHARAIEISPEGEGAQTDAINIAFNTDVEVNLRERAIIEIALSYPPEEYPSERLLAIARDTREPITLRNAALRALTVALREPQRRPPIDIESFFYNCIRNRECPFELRDTAFYGVTLFGESKPVFLRTCADLLRRGDSEDRRVHSKAVDSLTIASKWTCSISFDEAVNCLLSTADADRTSPGHREFIYSSIVSYKIWWQAMPISVARQTILDVQQLGETGFLDPSSPDGLRVYSLILLSPTLPLSKECIDMARDLATSSSATEALRQASQELLDKSYSAGWHRLE